MGGPGVSDGDADDLSGRPPPPPPPPPPPATPPGDHGFVPPQPTPGTGPPSTGYGAAGPYQEGQWYGSAGPGYHYGQGYVPLRTDPMAGWSLGVSIVSVICCAYASPVGLGLGIASLGRIRDSGDALQGRGLAIAGIVIGAIGTAILILLFVLMVLYGTSGWYYGT